MNVLQFPAFGVPTVFHLTGIHTDDIYETQLGFGLNKGKDVGRSEGLEKEEIKMPG